MSAGFFRKATFDQRFDLRCGNRFVQKKAGATGGRERLHVFPGIRSYDDDRQMLAIHPEGLNQAKPVKAVFEIDYRQCQFASDSARRFQRFGGATGEVTESAHSI